MRFNLEDYASAKQKHDPTHGILTDGEGSVQLISSLR